MPPRRPTPAGPDEPGGRPGRLVSGQLQARWQPAGSRQPVPQLITAPRVIPASPGSGVLAPGYVLITGGLITEVGQGPPPRPPDIALDSGVLVPGFVDLQVNGYFGTELMTAGAAGWALVANRLPETGTTAFLPTFVTAPLAELVASLRAAAVITAALPRAGARVLGVHLEGPFISPARPGAHNQSWIISPSPAAVDELLTAGSGLVALVTLAPERDGGMAAVEQLTAAGVLVSVGHSDATAGQVAAAASAGARMVTHLYNAQRPLHHREPGVVGQALADPRLTSGLIADLRHVAAQACVIAFAAAPGRICLVTDAAACAGMPPGSYLLGGEPIELLPGDDELPGGVLPGGVLPGEGELPWRAGVPVRADGTLAGSALRMDAGVANMMAAGIGLVAAVAAASRVPADLIRRPDLGRLAPGAAADLVWLGADLRTMATWVRGERVYPAR
jgi:N-acetylglucosamine-6-phosphate deacetylase